MLRAARVTSTLTLLDRPAIEVVSPVGTNDSRADAANPQYDALHSLKGLPHVIDIRNLGLIGAIELKPIAGSPTKRAFTAFLIALLAEVMPVWLAALIVTILWAIVAAVLVQTGRKKLKEAAPPVPEQTIETIKEDVQWAKTQMRSDTTSS